MKPKKEISLEENKFLITGGILSILGIIFFIVTLILHGASGFSWGIKAFLEPVLIFAGVAFLIIGIVLIILHFQRSK